jgi:hypothetical protein
VEENDVHGDSRSEKKISPVTEDLNGKLAPSLTIRVRPRA